MTINAAYFEKLSAQVDHATTCAELQRIVSVNVPGFAELQASIAEAEAVLAAAQALLTLSVADLPAIVTFLGSLKTDVLGPMLGPYTKFIAQQVELAAAVATFAAKVEDAAARIPSCVIAI